MRIPFVLCVALAVAQGAAAFSFPALATRRTSLSLRGSPAVNNRRVLASVRGPERRNVGVLALASTEGGAAAVAGYRFVDKRKEALLVLPVGEEVRRGDVEFEVSKTTLVLSVNGQTYASGELWGAVSCDESTWEIDEFEGNPRCVIVRLFKEVPADWQFLLKDDYNLADTTRTTWLKIGKKDPSKEEVEAALQLIVALMAPAGTGPGTTSHDLEKLEKEGTAAGVSEEEWNKAVTEAKEEEWKDTAEEMRRKMDSGASPQELQDLLAVTQEALQGGVGAVVARPAPIPAMVFIRHSIADAAEEDTVDSDLGRMLTVEGRSAAANARKWFGTLVAPSRAGAPPGEETVFSSCAGRCLETAFLAGAGEPIVLEGVYEGMYDAEALAAYKEVGNKPLKDYVVAGHAAFLRKYAERVVVEIAEGLASLPAVAERVKQAEEGQAPDLSKLSLGCVPVFGHSVYSAAVAMLIAQALRLNKDDTSLIASLTHGEAEGILVSASGAGHCNSDSTKLDPEVDFRTARTLSGVYASLKGTGRL